MIKRVIITGADGFIGSYTTECFLKKGFEVLAIGRKEKPQRLEKHDLLKYLQADLSDMYKLSEKIPDKNYDAVIHFAWDGSAGDKRKNRQLQIKNAIVSSELVSLTKEIKCNRFIGAGSIMEYEVEAAIASSDITMNENFYYSMGKLLAHILCKIEAEKCGIDLIWGVITNAYGEGETAPRFINTTIRKMLKREDLKFTSASQNYDFIHVRDLAEAFYAITVYGKPSFNYTLGSGDAKPLKEFIYQIRDIVAPESCLEFGSVNYTGVPLPKEFFSIKKLTEDTGFRQSINFESGIERTLRWITQNLE